MTFLLQPSLLLSKNSTINDANNDDTKKYFRLQNEVSRIIIQRIQLSRDLLTPASFMLE